MQQPKRESLFFNIIINIIIPTLILKKAGPFVGEVGALTLALAFPLAYSVRDVILKGKPNPISVFGFLNVAVTGGFALMELEGFWFAVKEAAFPLVIGLAVMASAWTKEPLIKFFLLNPDLFDVQKIQSHLETEEKKSQFETFLKTSTVYLALSFFLSSLLNYVLARSIFLPIPQNLPSAERSQILNDQIADMTWQGYIVIALPSTLILMLILVFIMRQIKRLTGLGLEDLVYKP